VNACPSAEGRMACPARSGGWSLGWSAKRIETNLSSMMLSGRRQPVLQGQRIGRYKRDASVVQNRHEVVR
jgi:hypothetical protein